MKNFLKSTLLLLVLTQYSCDSNKVYDKFDNDFTDNRWQKSDVKDYDFTISDASKSYNMILEFSHIAGFQFDNIPIRITITNPNQTKTTKIITLKIKDANGDDAGDCDGDYCDITQSVLKNEKLAAGKYNVSIANEFNNSFLPNVLGVGIKVTVSE